MTMPKNSNSIYQSSYIVPQMTNIPEPLNIQPGTNENENDAINIILPRLVNGDIVESTHVFTPLFPLLQFDNAVEITGMQNELP